MNSPITMIQARALPRPERCGADATRESGAGSLPRPARAATGGALDSDARTRSGMELPTAGAADAAGFGKWERGVLGAAELEVLGALEFGVFGALEFGVLGALEGAARLAELRAGTVFVFLRSAGGPDDGRSMAGAASTSNSE